MRILVIEDEPRLQRNLVRALQEEGYAVDASPEGAEGLGKARHCDYDAILLDVMLPGMNGWEVLKELRRHKATPVLMLTACDSTDDRVRGLDEGADDYLVKPFDLPELFARLRALIRRTVGRSSSTLQIGEITIACQARTVRRNGQPIALTAREYAILEYLALHRKELVTRTQLYEHILDEQDDTLSNLVDVHVFSLRKKLGHELIVTRRGQGYSIDQ
jgi:two-component system OmpR family response regulator